MTRVKICGIREADHARIALADGADMLGFVFYSGSHRCLSVEAARSLIRDVRASEGVSWQAVGLFVNEPLEVVQAVASDCGLDLVQLSGDEDVAYCQRLEWPFTKVVRPTRLLPEQRRRAADRATWGAERVLLDAHVPGRFGGTGEVLPWRDLREIAEHNILAGGLSPANVARAVAEARPWGVDVSSGVEAAGRKEPSLIRAFIEEVRRVDEQCAAASRN